MMRYRKTRQGEWVVFGPAADLQAAAADGAWVTVEKSGGGRDQVTIARVGRPFAADGTEMAYGYTAVTVIGSAPAAPGAPAARRSRTCDNCGEHPGRHERTDSSGIAGYVCNTCAQMESHALSFA